MKTKNPFVNIYLFIRRRWTRCRSLSEQIFWLSTMGVIIVLVAYMVVNIVRHSNPVFMGFYLLLLFINFVNMRVAYKTKKYEFCLTLYFIMIICFVNPFCFFTGGGFSSSTMILSLLPLLMLWMHDNKKMRLILAALNLIAVSATYTLALVFPEMVNHPQINSEPGIIAASVIVAITIFLVQYFIRSDEKKKEELKFRELEKKNDVKIALLKIQLESVEDVKRMRHDMRHHNAIVAEYARNNDMAGLLDYLEKKNKFDESLEKKVFCMNSLLNNILTVYDDMAKTEAVSFDVQANVSNTPMPYNDAEIVTLFANVVENAIHAAKKADTHSVCITLNEKNGKLVFITKNTCVKGITVENGMIANPGTGVSSILKFVHKYGCDIEYSLSENEITCTIIINLEK